MIFFMGGGGGGGNILKFLKCSACWAPQPESGLEKSFMYKHHKFCAVTINVSTKHSVSTIPVKLIKVYGRMTSCPNSVGRWILMAKFDRP